MRVDEAFFMPETYVEPMAILPAHRPLDKSGQRQELAINDEHPHLGLFRYVALFTNLYCYIEYDRPHTLYVAGE
jgi:hypothetical protein